MNIELFIAVVLFEVCFFLIKIGAIDKKDGKLMYFCDLVHNFALWLKKRRYRFSFLILLICIHN